MTLLDAYALIAFLSGGRALADVGALIRGGGCAATTVNLAELFDVLERVKGVPAEQARGAVEPLLDGPLETIPLSLEVARDAGEIRAAHYDRKARPLSLADCVLLATGGEGDRLATADPHVLAVAPLVGLDTVKLPGEG